MNKYNTKFIKDYIEQNQQDIDYVECGMKEDWRWTAEIVFSAGKLDDDYDWESDSINVAGITGSTWATPVMLVHFKDGFEKAIPCYFDDGVKTPSSQIAQQKAFAAMTFGSPLFNEMEE